MTDIVYKKIDNDTLEKTDTDITLIKRYTINNTTARLEVIKADIQNKLDIAKLELDMLNEVIK